MAAPRAIPLWQGDTLLRFLILPSCPERLEVPALPGREGVHSSLRRAAGFPIIPRFRIHARLYCACDAEARDVGTKPGRLR
jgi:hypothetical protein